ncbi:hypothetical protein QA644_34565 (plasmid) [Rhizobium sp. CC1099]|nr:hypothetical protein [Rhizobium sp. CC1099]WFU92020.1 hypothetical protein QA644_34565 [Rhizobium sp. CC1099]
MEWPKWFDTNYHYIVPELDDDLTFTLSSTKPIDHFPEAKAIGIHIPLVILGPIAFLSWLTPLPKSSSPSRCCHGFRPSTSNSCGG